MVELGFNHRQTVLAVLLRESSKGHKVYQSKINEVW